MGISSGVAVGGTGWTTSRDGYRWSAGAPLARMGRGQYQISWHRDGLVGTAFNYHPPAFGGNTRRSGLNWRTNLYYVETDDGGRHWRSGR